MGTEEEVSKMGGMWERRNANAPVGVDESRGSVGEGGLRVFALTERCFRWKPIAFALEQALHS